MRQPAISGETRFAVMLGAPVRQTQTPRAFNEWAAEARIDAVMIAIDVAEDRLFETLTALRGWRNCIGAVVTYPHKQATAKALDTAEEEVHLLGACNVVRRGPDGQLHGGSTDGAGFVAALRSNGFELAGIDARLIGAGGAGAAIALALVQAGVGRLVLADVEPSRASALADRLAGRQSVGHVLTTAPDDFDCALVCNATPVGMNGDPAHPCSLDDLPQDCFVADIVPNPAQTPWVAEARRRGHRTQTGPEMVANQLPLVVRHLFGHFTELAEEPG